MRRIEILPGANRHKRPLWSELIFALDSWLQRREGVFEYSHKPECIFRAQLSRLSSEVLLSDGTFGRPGDRVIDLHFWNEQIPATPIAGYSLAWGCRFSRSFAQSIRELTRFLMSEPEVRDTNIIRAKINLDSLQRIAVRHGFESILDPVRLSPWEYVHRFGENILYWLLTLACNSGGAWPKTFWRSRKVIYLSRRVLERKHIAPTMLAASGRRRQTELQSSKSPKGEKESPTEAGLSPTVTAPPCRALIINITPRRPKKQPKKKAATPPRRRQA